MDFFLRMAASSFTRSRPTASLAPAASATALGAKFMVLAGDRIICRRVMAPAAVERARAVVESDATSASRRASVGLTAREGARGVG